MRNSLPDYYFKEQLHSNCRFQISGLKSEAVLSLAKTRDLMFKFSKFLVPETFYGLARIENRVTVCYFHLELFCIFSLLKVLKVTSQILSLECT